MNTRVYIESGILEAYVLDALTPGEKLEVEANIALYPELATELKAIEEGMLAFAEAGAQAPPADLKEKIWDSILLEKEERSNVRPFVPQPTPKQVYWQRAAIWITLIGSLVANYILWSRNDKIEQQQVAMNQQMDSLKQERFRLSRLAENSRKEDEMLADTSMQAVVMKTMQPGHPMAATVYWSKDNGDIYLTIQKLPPPPAGKQYQLWVIQGGSPVSMGVIPNDVVTDGLITKLPMQVTNGQAFAISLEKEGGNPTPTEVQVLGKPS